MSLLGLPLSELNELSQRHLLYSEIFGLPELSLYVLQLAFLVKKEGVLKQCTLLDCNDRKRLELLNQLEDRNVCGRVLLRIAHLYDWPEKTVYFRGAYVRLLVQVEEDSLDGEELFLIAIGIFSIRRKWTKEVERLMLLSAARGNFAYALTALGGYYIKTGRHQEAVILYEKGCSLGYANCMYELALITPYGDPKKVELHLRASSHGHRLSTYICKREGWLLDVSQ